MREFLVTVVVTGPRLRLVRFVGLMAASEAAAKAGAVEQAKIAWSEGERFVAGPAKVVGSPA